MRKLWVLAWKEVRLAFRDVGAIITMLVTPLVLTLVIGAAFSGSGNAGLTNIPVLLIDHDGGVFAQDLIGFFDYDEVQELIALDVVRDEAAARRRVAADEVAALVVIPEGFSAAVFPLGAAVQETADLDLLSLTPDSELSPEQQAAIARAFGETREAERAPVTLEIIQSPDWLVSGSIVKGVVQQAIETMAMQVQGTTIVMGHLFTAQMTASPSDGAGAPGAGVSPGDLMAQGMAQGMEVGQTGTSELPIRMTTVSRTGRSFSWLSYTAGTMSVLFLMFAVTSGGRTLLAERSYGTLPRLLVSPLPALTVLLGKMAGVVLTGLLQMVLLWGATSLLGAYWGPVPAVLTGILALVLCASGVGALISAWSKTQGQASAIGTAVTLTGSALSGTFFPRSGIPDFIQKVSLVTPNAWGIEIFSRTQLGRGLIDILPLLGGVLLLTAAYYGLAMLGFRRQFD